MTWKLTNARDSAEKSALPRLTDPIDNDYWFDDTSDGCVRATIVFETPRPQP